MCSWRRRWKFFNGAHVGMCMPYVYASVLVLNLDVRLLVPVSSQTYCCLWAVLVKRKLVEGQLQRCSVDAHLSKD